MRRRSWSRLSISSLISTLALTEESMSTAQIYGTLRQRVSKWEEVLQGSARCCGTIKIRGYLIDFLPAKVLIVNTLGYVYKLLEDDLSPTQIHANSLTVLSICSIILLHILATVNTILSPLYTLSIPTTLTPCPLLNIPRPSPKLTS